MKPLTAEEKETLATVCGTYYTCAVVSQRIESEVGDGEMSALLGEGPPPVQLTLIEARRLIYVSQWSG